MRIYEARLVYEATLFEVGTTALTSPDRVYAYMQDILETHPMQEVFYVILLNQTGALPTAKQRLDGTRSWNLGLFGSRG